MAKDHITAEIATTGHQLKHLKLSLSGAPSPALLSPAIKGTITDPDNKTKPFAHLLMAEMPNASSTSCHRRRRQTRGFQRLIFRGRTDTDWKNAVAIEDSDDTIIDMILERRLNECGAPTAGIMQQAKAAYFKMEEKAEREAAEEAEQITINEMESSDFGRAFSWSDVSKPASLS